MTEKELRKKIVRENKTTCIVPIETGDSSGVPDLFVQNAFFSGWVELKQIKRLVTEKFSVRWEPGQMSWAKRHQSFGGLWAVVIHVNNRIWFTSVPKEEYILSELKEFKTFDDVFFYTYCRLHAGY